MGAVSALAAISPDAMMVITVAVCVSVIVAYTVYTRGQEALQRELREFDPHETLTYSQAMAYLNVSEHHPAGMLVGVWGTDPNTEAWWWRCSLCREHGLCLTPDACAAASSAHVCAPAALEAAKREAKAQHPAFRFPDPSRREPW